jgi:hypothetical protein
MGGPDGPSIAWCAPQRPTDAGAHWRAFCLPFGETTYVWAEGKPALMPLSLAWLDRTAHQAPEPKLTRGPAPLPDMKLAYAFGGWDKRGWLVLQVTLDWGDGPQLLRAIALPPSADGVVNVKLLGGEIALRRAGPPASAAAVAQVLVAPKAGAAVIF